jgi:glycogen phosphorylase
MRIMGLREQPIEKFHEQFAIQLNDTHPAIAVAELMRLLLDKHNLDWESAWGITQKTFGYTNHTLLPEALEKWPVSLFKKFLPRHLEIIYEINARFLEAVQQKFPNDNERLRRMSLIDENGERYVRMANLACVGSHAINGVAELHSKLLKQTVLRDFYEFYPEKFTNKTNGVTPRRFVALSNPKLTKFINSHIGENWIKSLSDLRELEKFVDDAGFNSEWRKTKQAIKQDLAQHIQQRLDIIIDPNSLFDVQVKRIHEYKRQHLNILYVVSLYNRIKQNPNLEITPRTFIFGGKAAPGYYMAKLIIKLINSVAEVINNDPTIGGKLKVVFLPDYNVTNSQRVYPAADLSEQISTAGLEASGTGNMKFAINGALTIGTLDGANVEIRQEVGEDNFFLFGLTTEEVYQLKSQGYNPWEYYNQNPELKEVINLLGSGYFSRGDSNLFQPMLSKLLNQDPFLLLADFQSYIDCQEKVGKAYQNQELWTRMSILNTARMGKFSSDRAIKEYCEEIWNVQPVQIQLQEFFT